MSVRIHADFETRSTIDLRKVGMDAYSEHPTTDAMCMCYSIGDLDVQEWRWGNPFPEELVPYFESGDYLLCGHNVGFEVLIWNNVMHKRHGWPKLDPAKTRCTAAMARAAALPGDLAGAAQAVQMDVNKDEKGKRIMLQLCKPRRVEKDGTVVWWDDPNKYEILVAYCKVDVLVERGLDQRLLNLTSYEQRVWELDFLINARGIAVDRQACLNAAAIVEAELQRLNDEMYATTDCRVTATSNVAQIADYLSTIGYPVSSLDKAAVSEALADPNLPPKARRVLELRQEAAKSSTAKLKPMLDSVSADGRLHGLFLYHGATTGRWAGRRVQTQNFPRPHLSQADIEAAIDLMELRDPTALEITLGRPMDVVASCLRGMLVAADGKVLSTADFANIEGRGLAWIGGEEWKLQAFRDYDTIIPGQFDKKGKPLRAGPDLYLVAANNIMQLTGLRADRQVGKVVELSMGYQGGVGAFQTMAKNYGVNVGDDIADTIKGAWRETHPKIVRFWYALEEAAIEAVLNPGCRVYAAKKRITFLVHGSFLYCRLPSGRTLAYPYPKVQVEDTRVGEKEVLSFYGQDTYTRKWGRQQTYGGKLAENVTQALCRDILADSALRCDALFPVVMHVHDEIVTEHDPSLGDHRDLEKIMEVPPAWATGLPIAAEGWTGKRYRK